MVSACSSGTVAVGYAGDLIRLLDSDGLTVASYTYGDEGGQAAISDEYDTANRKT